MQLINRDSQVVNVPPDIPFETWEQVLKDANSPALPFARDCYDRVIKWRVSPALILGIFKKESGFGKNGFATVHLSLGNTRSTVLQNGIVVNTVQGYYVRYKSWADSVEDTAARLALPTYIYAREGRTTISQILTRYAPPTENDTQGYIDLVVNSMNEWIGGGTKMFDINSIPFKQSPNYNAQPNSMQKIVIHATMGSYDSSVGWLLGSASQASAHYIISEDGSKAIQLVHDNEVAWHTGVWSYNLMCIGIEHSWFYAGHDGTPPDALLRAGAALTAKLCSDHNITPNRTNIIRHGEIPPPNTHVDPPSPFDMDKFMSYVLAAYNGGTTVLTTDNHNPIPTPAPAPQFPTNKIMGGGFLAFYNKLKAAGLELLTFGYPVTNEFDCLLGGKIRTVQLGERAGLIWEPENQSPWDVHFLATTDLLTATTMAKSKGLI